MPEKNGLQPLTIDNLAGGITDFYLGGEASQWEAHDNQVYTDNFDSETRPGSRVKYPAKIDETYALRTIVDHNDEILMQSGPKLQLYSGGVQSVLSVDGHNVFTLGDDAMRASFSYWNGHTIAASDAYTSIQRVYRNEDNAWTAENLGLPEIIFAGSIRLANSLKATFNAHIMDISIHAAADPDNTVISDDAYDLPSLLELTAELLENYAAHQFDGSGSQKHLVKDDVNVLETAEAPATLFQAYTRLLNLKNTYNAHDAEGDYYHSVGSTHQETEVAEPVLTAGTAGTNTYLYGFSFLTRYWVGDKEFLEESRIQLVQLEDTSEPDSGPVAIASIPELVNGVTENWNVANIKVRIYRTTNGGTNLYYLTELENGTATFTDGLSDEALTNREPAYTEGGVLDNDLPPPAKYCEVVGSTLILGHYRDGFITYDNRTIRSKPGQLFAVPGDNFQEYEGTITGIAKAKAVPVVFLKDKCYREEGSFDSTGAGVVRQVLISEKVGCVSHESIVNTEDGVYFASENGFYFTDGYSVRLISTDLHSRYRALANKSKIKGAFHSSKEWVLWSVQTDSDSTENDSVWCAHLKFQTPKGGHPISTWSGGLDAENFSACDIAYVGGVLYRADHRGYLLYHDETLRTDPFIDVLASPVDWYTQTIFWDMRSVAFDFGDAQCRKWVPKFNINCDNQTTLHCQVETQTDNVREWFSLRPIVDSSRVAWGDRSVAWQEGGLRWNYAAVISQARYFPAVDGARVRCMYRQMRFTNAYITIDESGEDNLATVDAGAKTITLNDLTKSWVDDPVNYYISFADDDYTTEFKIIAKADQTITVQDNNNLLTTTAATAWKVRGYKKNEAFTLLNYVISYRPITMSQSPFRSSSGD